MLSVGFRAPALAGLIVLLVVGGCVESVQTTGDGGSARGNPGAESEAWGDQAPTAKTLFSMADILATQGKDRECEFVLRRCIHQYPRFTPAYNSLAELQMRQGRTGEAVDVLSKALVVRPQDPVLLNNLGMCFLVRKEYDRALKSFTRAAAIVPEAEKYRANMATALGMLGRHEEALALLRQVLPADQAEYNAAVLQKAHARGG